MPKVDIETDYIEKLAELLARTGLTEIEICQGDARIRVARQVAAAVEYVQAAPQAATAPVMAAAQVAEPAAEAAPHPGTITSPMVGTAYLFPEPGAAAFVRVGDEVKEGSPLFQIDDRPYKATLDQARASLEIAQASYVKTRSDYEIALNANAQAAGAISAQELNKRLGARDESKASIDQAKATIQGEWIRTGDKYSRDADGYFWYQGRSDDMLKAGGYWVSPAEVESTLAAHPAVLECGVVGREDDERLVKPVAFVVLRPGHSGDRALVEELQAFVKARLAPYKFPRWIEFVPDLPRTATGKLQRYKLRELANPHRSSASV